MRWLPLLLLLLVHCCEARRQTAAQSFACPPSPEGYSLRVLVTGLIRSGSTWQFNSVLGMLRQSNITAASFHGHAPKEKHKMLQVLRCPVAVVKIHEFDAELLSKADVVLTSVRHVLDSYASVIRFNSKTGSWKAMFDHYARWREVADYEMYYEEFWSNETAELERLADALGLKIDAPRLEAELAAQLESVVHANCTHARGSGWDKATAYHKRHVIEPEPGRRFKLRGTEHEQGALSLQESLRDWMRANAYETDL